MDLVVAVGKLTPRYVKRAATKHLVPVGLSRAKRHMPRLQISESQIHPGCALVLFRSYCNWCTCLTIHVSVDCQLLPCQPCSTLLLSAAARALHDAQCRPSHTRCWKMGACLSTPDTKDAKAPPKKAQRSHAPSAQGGAPPKQTVPDFGLGEFWEVLKLLGTGADMKMWCRGICRGAEGFALR